MSQFEFEECAVATDGSEIWRNGVRYVAEPAVIPKPVPFANPSCQHRSINNDTWQCEACGETMIGCDADGFGLPHELFTSLPYPVAPVVGAAGGSCGGASTASTASTAVPIPSPSAATVV